MNKNLLFTKRMTEMRNAKKKNRPEFPVNTTYRMPFSILYEDYSPT